ncbi:MAG: TetR/AcrR family transcriptional regulator [Marinomonas sp.]
MRDQTMPIDLDRRAKPQQKRAEERIESILDATEAMLRRMAVDDITTSAVAKEAGIPVGTVYRYFPNIYAVYSAIFARFNQDAIAVLLEEEAGRVGRWQDELAADLNGVTRLFEDQPAYRAVYLLTLTTRELASVRETWNMQLAEHLARGWAAGDDGFSGEDASVIARMVIEIFTAAQMQILRNWDDKAKCEAIAKERMTALEGYLQNYLH